MQYAPVDVAVLYIVHLSLIWLVLNIVCARMRESHGVVYFFCTLLINSRRLSALETLWLYALYKYFIVLYCIVLYFEIIIFNYNELGPGN